MVNHKEKRIGQMLLKKGFTLLEILAIVVIVALLASFSGPWVHGYLIKSKTAELLVTVTAIEKAEEAFNFKYGFYAAAEDGITGYDLPYSITQEEIDNFVGILELEIPELNSIFVYGVYYKPARISVQVRKYLDWGVLCYKWLEGPDAGRWYVNPSHPWSRYLTIR